MDIEVHAGEPYHVVVATREGDQLPVCNDAQRHAKKGPNELKVVNAARIESEHELRRKADQKALRESGKERASYLRELLNHRLPKASVTTLVTEAFNPSANQAPAKAPATCWDSTLRASARTTTEPGRSTP